MMRGAFCLQRALANDLTFPVSDPGHLPTPQLVTSRQCVEMMTIAGAAASGLLDKVGTLTPGKEADIVILDYNNINYQPMNNVYGTIVTMMDTRAVRHVMIAGKFVYWHGKLVGWDVDKLTRQVVESRDRVLARINGPATGDEPGRHQQREEQRRPSVQAGLLDVVLLQRPERARAALCAEAVEQHENLKPEV